MYKAFPLKNHLRPVYLRKQVDILLFHPRNLRDISNETSSCLTKELDARSVMPPSQIMRHVKEIFLLLSKSWSNFFSVIKRNHVTTFLAALYLYIT